MSTKPMPDKPGFDMNIKIFEEREDAILGVGDILANVCHAVKAPVFEGTAANMMLMFTSLAAIGVSPSQLVSWIMTGCALYVKTIAILEKDAAEALVADLIEKLKKKGA